MGEEKTGEGNFSFALFSSPVFSRPFFLTHHLFKNPKTFHKIKRLLRRLRRYMSSFRQ
jgi:hypothetical protein